MDFFSPERKRNKRFGSRNNQKEKNVWKTRERERAKKVVLVLFFFLFVFLTAFFFLDAPSHLYKRVCPSVGPSVRPSDGPSPVIFEGEKYAY